MNALSTEVGTFVGRHWIVYAGPTVRVSDEVMRGLLETRNGLRHEIRGPEPWESAEHGTISLPPLVRVRDIFGSEAWVNPAAISSIVEFDPDAFCLIEAFNAGVRALIADAHGRHAEGPEPEPGAF